MSKRANLNIQPPISVFLLWMVAAVLMAGNARAAKMYWTEYGGSICRANLDGSDKEVVVTTEFPEGIALDIGCGKIYWNTAYSNQRVMRANLDGGNIETLISTGLDYANKGMALNLLDGEIWWAGCYDMKIHKANLDGSSHTTPISTSSRAGDVALDLSAGKVYYTVIINGAPEICRANFDGSNKEVLINSDIANPWGIDLDVIGGKMYWTNYGIEKVMRADLDGSNIEELITSGLKGPIGIALDVHGGKMYITNTGGSMDPVGFIQRANLDGSNLETLLTGLNYCKYIDLDLEAAAKEPVVWVLHDKDPDYSNPPFGDTLTALGASGEVLIRKSGFNICQTIGGSRAVAVSNFDQTVLVCENVSAESSSEAPRIMKYDFEGNEIFTIGQHYHSYSAVDVSDNGTIFALTSSGTIYGDAILKVSPDGNVLADRSIGGFDLVVDDVLGGIYVVGADIKYCNFDLELQWTIDPVEWCAVSVDTCSDGTAWVAVRDEPGRLHHISPDGTILKTIYLDYVPYCLRVDKSDNSIYVGSKELHKYDENGSSVWSVPLPCSFGYLWSGWSLDIDSNRRGIWVGTAKDVRLISFDGDTLLVTDEFLSMDQKYVACCAAVKPALHIYYVDSVNDNDNSDGLTPDSPGGFCERPERN